jgi:Tfp pilus assembly protein PilW
MNRLAREESGFTMVELVIVMFVTVLLMAGLSNMFISGLRASTTAGSRLSAQSNVNVALSRLEYETRCASAAALISGGTGVTLTLPAQCTHATGTWTYCVTAGNLEEFSGSACSGTGTILASNVTSATPFSCLTTVGTYPRLQISLTVNPTTTAGNATSATEQVTMRNAALSTAGAPGCA